MPYDIKKSDSCPVAAPWALVRADGTIKSCHATKQKAEMASSIIMRVEHRPPKKQTK